MAKGHSTQAWPADLVERITALWTDGYSAGYIARDTGKTRNAVISKLHRLDLMRGVKRVYDPGVRTKKIQQAAREPGRLVVPKKIVPPYVEPPPSIPAHQLVKLIDLEPHHCRWPIGDPRHPDFGFCGARKTVASTYCQQHFSESRQDLPVKTGQFVLYEQRRQRAG